MNTKRIELQKIKQLRAKNDAIAKNNKIISLT